jgi:hypothetical protein
VNDFAAFYRHVGSKPSSDLSIDRLNNNGSYKSGNLAWRSASEQVRNRRPRSEWKRTAS